MTFLFLPLPSDLIADHTRGQAALSPAALTGDASTLTREGPGGLPLTQSPPRHNFLESTLHTQNHNKK